MSDIQTLTSEHITALSGAQAAPGPARAQVVVERVDASRLAQLEPAWIDLLKRAAAPNVFMDPAMLSAAAAAFPNMQCRTLLAWRRHKGSTQLVGVWAFGVGRAQMSALPLRVIAIPPYPHAYLASPVIDSTCLDETLDAMLDQLADDLDLPSIVAVDSITIEGATFEALIRVLANRGTKPLVVEQYRRPKLVSRLDAKAYFEQVLSASTRKKLRQHRRRLSEKGTLDSVIASDPQTVREALEQFLILESGGWKGRQATALLSNPADAAFMRSAIASLAESGRACLHSLTLDGRPLSMQIVIRSGNAAFTWKTAYDEEYHDFSPGMLLLEDYTAALLSDKTIEYVDSCARGDDGFMSAWADRDTIADIWINTPRGGSMAFRLFGVLQKHYRDLRAAAKQQYLKHRPSVMRRKRAR